MAGLTPLPAAQGSSAPSSAELAVSLVPPGASAFSSARELSRFALAVVSTGSYQAAARLCRPDLDKDGQLALAAEASNDPTVASRVDELRIVRNQLPISAADHAERIATIRDLAIAKDSLDVALKAETKLGELAGLYIKRIEVEKKNYVVNFTQPSASMAEWAARAGAPSAKVENEAIDVTPTRIVE